MSNSLKLTVLERDDRRRRVIVDALRAVGVRVFEAPDPHAAAESLEVGDVDALVISLSEPAVDPGALREAVCPTSPGLPVSLEAAERVHIARTLAAADGNRRQTALILGISRSTLLHKLRKYGLDKPGSGRRTRRDGGE